MTAQAQVRANLLEELNPALTLSAITFFAAVDRFAVGMGVGGRTIEYLGPNFRHHFGSVIDENVPIRTFKRWRLATSSRDTAIVDVLGGERKAELKLAHVFKVMQTGASLMDGRANVTYARSPRDSKLWTVLWFVSGSRWVVGARPLSEPGEWEVGSCVFGG